MSGADTILSLIVAMVLITTLLFVAGVFNMVVGPVWQNVVDPALLKSLGWSSPQDVVLLFAGIALIAMLVIVFVWWVTKPIREDVRQEEVRGRL